MDPDIGEVLIPNNRLQITEGFIEAHYFVETSSQGLREEWVPPADGFEFRILGLGDSTTFGVSVSREQTFLYLLRGELQRRLAGRAFRTINTGVPAWGPIEELRFLKKRGREFQPNLTLIMFSVGTDVVDSYVLRSMGPMGSLSASPAANYVIDWVRSHLHTYHFLWPRLRSLMQRPDPQTTLAPTGEGSNSIPALLHGALAMYQKEPNPVVERAWQQTAGYLGEIKSTAQSLGSPLVLVAIPNKEQVDEAFWSGMQKGYGFSGEPYDLHLPQERLNALAKTLDIPLLDLLPAFKVANQQRALYFGETVYPHFNAAGHRLAAELIADYLVSSSFLKGSASP